ncbi:MAG: triphosphoribosyl-dephospho-CoA synthase, partial [Natronomonas sp.]
EATERAQAVLVGREDADDLAAEFVERDINPGTTADLTAAALFIALERGLEV